MTWTFTRRGGRRRWRTMPAADDAVAQEIQLRYSEHALLQVGGQTVEDGEQCAEVRPVLLAGFAEDPVII
jgi:hypothetical protein